MKDVRIFIHLLCSTVTTGASGGMIRLDILVFAYSFTIEVT